MPERTVEDVAPQHPSRAAVVPSGHGLPAEKGGPATRSFKAGVAIWAVILGALMVLYTGFYDAEFYFDDVASIVGNESIQGTWGEAWWPKENNPTASRPLTNASLWINWQVSGTHPWSYLLLNRLLHLATAAALFAVLRLTLRRFGGVWGDATASAVGAGVVTLLWAIHPLTTEITAYSTQRTEVLACLFMTLAMWAALRAWDAEDPPRWGVFASIFVLLGALSKEIAAVTPVLILLWDLAFGPGTITQRMRKRWGLYVGVALPAWVALFFILREGPMDKSIGFHHGISGWTYLLTQGQVILLYLKLSYWPTGLSIWHEVPWHRSLASAWPTVLPVALLGLAAVAMWFFPRTRWIAFVLSCLFVILGPTSSVIPIITEPAAERRMYLPLVALVALPVLPMLAFCLRRSAFESGLILAASAAIVLGSLTWHRLHQLQTAREAWMTAWYLYPHSSLILSGVGQAFIDYERNIEVSNRYYEIAYGINKNDWRISGSYGRTLNLLRRWEEALPPLELAVNIAQDGYPDGLANLGDAYVAMEDETNAIDAFSARVLMKPENAGYRNDLGVVLMHFERYQEAIDQYQRARQLDPMLGIVALNLGDALLKVDRPDLAEPQLYDAIQLIDDEEVLWGAYGKRGLALSRIGKLDEAIASYQRAVELFDKDAETWNNFGVTLGRAGRLDEAVSAFEQALAIDPEYEEPRENMALIERLKGETPVRTE